MGTINDIHKAQLYEFIDGIALMRAEQQDNQEAQKKKN